MGYVIQFVSFSLILALQQPATIGEVARRLSAQDIADLTSKLPSGSAPWLLSGDRSQLPGLQHIDAYIAPTSVTPVLRKGRVISLERRIALTQAEVRLNGEKVIVPYNSSPTDWMIRSSADYVQVAIEGRSFDLIQSDSDLNRPFRVSGMFEDDELIALVRRLRTNPEAAGENFNGRITGRGRVESLPIDSISRQGDGSVRVMTRRTASEGQAITVRQEGGEWKVISIALWIA